MTTAPRLDGPMGQYVASSIRELHDAWRINRRGVQRPAYERVRSFCDYYRAHPDLLAAAIADQPTESGWAAFDSLLAGVAETLADDAGIARPPWTAEVVADTATWPHDETDLDEHWQPRTPAPLLVRGLLIDSESLWHAWPIYGRA